MKLCEKLLKKELEINKDFIKFADGCFCPKTYDKKYAEFMRIKTKINLGVNDMAKVCKNENCPSNFCKQLYEDIMKEVPKKE